MSEWIFSYFYVFLSNFRDLRCNSRKKQKCQKISENFQKETQMTENFHVFNVRKSRKINWSKTENVRKWFQWVLHNSEISTWKFSGIFYPFPGIITKVDFLTFCLPGKEIFGVNASEWSFTQKFNYSKNSKIFKFSIRNFRKFSGWCVWIIVHTSPNRTFCIERTGLNLFEIDQSSFESRNPKEHFRPFHTF